MVIDSALCRWFWDARKTSLDSSDHSMFSLEVLPATRRSSGARYVEQFGTTLEINLYASRYDLSDLTVGGREQVVSVDMRCGDARSWPEDQTHPSTVVDSGAITVFFADKTRRFAESFCNTLSQFLKSSSGLSPPQ